jgi:hypothetical protein
MPYAPNGSKGIDRQIDRPCLGTKIKNISIFRLWNSGLWSRVAWYMFTNVSVEHTPPSTLKNEVVCSSKTLVTAIISETSFFETLVATDQTIRWRPQYESSTPRKCQICLIYLTVDSVKLSFSTTSWCRMGTQGYSSVSSLTSTLEQGEQQASRYGRFYFPGKNTGISWTH